ncbi:MAG TPA: NACHT domain-containing protein, partial [Longimicrobium sp.]|nr:NACHT domain-containing protein [Longimicrobium sp.]
MPDVTVSGNDNFVIVAGGDVYLSTAPAAPPTGDDRRNLVNLLGRVRRIWITNVLERSVSHAVLLDPPARMETAAVEPRWRRYVEEGGQSGILPPDSSIGQVFEDAGQMLLILGEPGAGKTTTLLTLTRECVERAERDPAAPVPVVLNLSSWKDSQPFYDWLVDELSDPGNGYSVGEAFARRWLEEHRLLLLLDGLDEVAEERRAACVQALHAFVEKHGAPGLAVCCRSTEYRALPVHLKLGGAVLLLPLEQGQIDAYLDAAGPALDGLRGALAGNAEFRGLSESPLMLSIMTLAFHGLPAGALRFDEGSTRAELREEIFRRFVDRMFVLRERPDDGFSRGRVEDGLRWLASGMRERGSIFAVELLQPEWLTRRQLLLYTIGSRVAGATVVTVAIGVVMCLGALVVALAAGAAIGEALASVGGMTMVFVTFAAAVAMGVAAGLFYVPLGYRALCRPGGEGRREPGMAEELALFFGYLGLSGLAALLVVGIGRWGFGLPMREPPGLASFITVSTSALSLPLIFGRKAGRGSADRDIGLAGSLSWQRSTAVELLAVCAITGGGLILSTPQDGATRLQSGIIACIAAFALVMYASWRQEVPPVEQWRDGGRNSALRDSGRIFAYAGLACVLIFFPLLALAPGLEQSLGVSFSLALLLAIVLFSPALFWFGGIDLVLHGTLRLVLALTGTMPLRLRRFLEYAVHLGFLRRAGGGYTFYHRLLLEHFEAGPAPDGGSAAKDPAAPTPLLLSDSRSQSMSNIQVDGDGNVVFSSGRDINVHPPGSAQPAGSRAPVPLPAVEPPLPFIRYLRDRLVAEKGLHDLSRNAELASFPLIGFHASTVSMDFVAVRAADRLTESQIVSLRNEFFDAVQHVSREFGLRPRGRNPNGLLAFVFEEGCPESMARFIRKQTRISHHASTGAVTVSWAIDLRHRRIHTHENPVSIFPPVIVIPQTVFPGLGWLESILAEPSDDAWRDGASAGPAAAAPLAPRPAADRIRILFLGANSTRAPLDLEREVSRIQQDLRMARERDALEFRHVGAVTSDTLMQAMLDESPTIVHFAGHGRAEGILLRDEMGNPRLVTADALASLFALFRDTVRCVVLNACWSEAQAHAIHRHVPHVIGTR